MRKGGLLNFLVKMITYELAIQSGIEMRESKAQKLSSNQHTFLTKRFDRNVKGERIHFALGVTLLGYRDGTDASSGLSYLKLVDFITKNDANPELKLYILLSLVLINSSVSMFNKH